MTGFHGRQKGVEDMDPLTLVLVGVILGMILVIAIHPAGSAR